jgi:quercetin dioxygenase-like cupin family protein
MRRKVNLATMTAVVVALLMVGGAVATSGSGVSASLLARAAFIDNVDLKVTVQTEGATKVAKVRSGDVLMQHILIGPGGNTGWHTHPGPVIVLIAAGTLTLYDGDDVTCTGHPYTAGQSFVDIGSGHVHLGRNLSATDTVELYVTYLGVPAGAGPRIDAADPGTC